GTPIATVTADSNGNYTVPLSPALIDGEAVTVTASDAGGESAGTPITAPDTTAPAAPTATINADGTEITGTTEPNAAITVKDAAGTSMETITADSNGNYTVPLSPALIDGEAVTVTASDAGGESAGTPITAPDTTAPAAPVITMGYD